MATRTTHYNSFTLEGTSSFQFSHSPSNVVSFSQQQTLIRRLFSPREFGSHNRRSRMLSVFGEVEKFNDPVARNISGDDGDMEPSFAGLDLENPPDHLLQYARLHLEELPDTKESVIQEFKDLIYERGDVMPHRMDDPFLVRFLRARRFNVEKSYRLMTRYYQFKENNPEMHDEVNPLHLKFIGDDDVLSVLPNREQTGRRIMIYKMDHLYREPTIQTPSKRGSLCGRIVCTALRASLFIGNWNPSLYSMDEIMKATVAVLECAILEQRAQILGGICLIDMGNVSLQHAWNITPSIASKIVELMVTSFPVRTHAIHIVNQSWVFDIIYTIFRPMLDERMKEKIYFHGDDLDSLHAHIDPKFLPACYGGVQPEFSYMDWMDSLRNNPRIVREEGNPHLRGGRVINHLGPPPIHLTDIRTLISPSSVVHLNTTDALANYATEAVAVASKELTTYNYGNQIADARRAKDILKQKNDWARDEA
uniref:CRAL-TRIO domain-containing protein n=1 Tax=Timema poppense TaxID=170557 RepID=A0A7R9D920_TIMPO|nr:unnamed protein product [Timema poppensis]